MKKNSRLLLSSLIINLGLIALSISGILKGIQKDQPWRIVIASVGGAIFLLFAILVIYNVIKSNKKAA